MSLVVNKQESRELNVRKRSCHELWVPEPMFKAPQFTYEWYWILTGDEVSLPASSNVMTSHFIFVQIMVCFVLGDIWLLRPINAFPGGWVFYVRLCVPFDLCGIIKENQKSVYFPKSRVKVCNCFHLFLYFCFTFWAL